MGLFHSPKIVTDGLVLALDAANPKSYPGTGTTWIDMSGNGHNATLHSVTHSSSNGGIFVISGTSSTFIDNNTIDLTSSDFTVFCASRHTGSDDLRLVGGRNNNFLVGHWNGYSEAFFAEGWVGGYSNNILSHTRNTTDWRVYHGCGNISADSYDFYVNDRTRTTGSNAGSEGPDGLIIGKTLLYTGGDYESGAGEVSFVYYYNRVLTKAETMQNFNAVRGRFGL